jgi:hypothetical protein
VPIPSYQQWIKDTSANIFTPRSANLRALDAAIQQYENSDNRMDLLQIKNTFDAWKRYKGNWRNSVRNRHPACAADRLDTELTTLLQLTRISASVTFAVHMGQGITLHPLGNNALITGRGKNEDFLQSCIAVFLWNTATGASGLYHYPSNAIAKDRKKVERLLRDMADVVRPNKAHLVYGDAQGSQELSGYRLNWGGGDDRAELKKIVEPLVATRNVREQAAVGGMALIDRGGIKTGEEVDKVGWRAEQNKQYYDLRDVGQGQRTVGAATVWIFGSAS